MQVRYNIYMYVSMYTYIYNKWQPDGYKLSVLLTFLCERKISNFSCIKNII